MAVTRSSPAKSKSFSTIEPPPATQHPSIRTPNKINNSTSSNNTDNVSADENADTIGDTDQHDSALPDTLQPVPESSDSILDQYIQSQSIDKLLVQQVIDELVQSNDVRVMSESVNNYITRLCNSRTYVSSINTNISLIQHIQLKLDKISIIIQYIIAQNVWVRLSSNIQVTILNNIELLNSSYYLLHHINTIHDTHNELRHTIVLHAMKYSIQQRNEIYDRDSGLSIADIFYTNTTQLHDFLTSLNLSYTQYAHKETNKIQRSIVLDIIGNVMYVLLDCAIEYRESHNIPLNGVIIDTLPDCRWTISDTVKQQLLLHCSTITQLAMELHTNNTQHSLIRQATYSTLFKLGGSILLDEYGDYASYLRSLNTTPYAQLAVDELVQWHESYVHDRKLIISYIRNIQSIDRNLSYQSIYQFAEQYSDYHTLIELCSAETIKIADSKLIEYMNKYGQLFANVLFHEFYKNNQSARLLSYSQPAEYIQWFTEFVHDKYDIKWLLYIQLKQYQLACNAIVDSYMYSDNTISEQRSLLHIAKLLLIAAELPDDSIEYIMINDEIDCLNIQLYMNPDIDQRLIRPDQLIQQLVDHSAAQHDIQAIVYSMEVSQKLYSGLVQLLGDIQYSTILYNIWLQCILFDDWLILYDIKRNSIGDRWHSALQHTALYTVLYNLTMNGFYERGTMLSQSLTTAVTSAELPDTLKQDNIQSLLQYTWQVVQHNIVLQTSM